jgi:four helix bundle protein
MLTYNYTKDFPRNEDYGLTSQIRRASLSIPTNIVEGHASTSKKDFLNFLNIANKSLVETEYLFEVANELQYLSNERYIELYKLKCEVGILLTGLTRSVRSKL